MLKFLGTCILTDNLPRLVDFYNLIFETTAQGDEVHSDYPDFQLAIYNPGDVRVPRDKNVNLMFCTDDVDGHYARLQKLLPAESLLCPPTDRPWGARSFFVRDPDGNEFSITRPPENREETA